MYEVIAMQKLRCVIAIDQVDFPPVLVVCATISEILTSDLSHLTGKRNATQTSSLKLRPHAELVGPRCHTNAGSRLSMACNQASTYEAPQLVEVMVRREAPQRDSFSHF